MFLIKPPFSAPSPGRLLSYGQIKEKEDSKEARRSQSEAGAEGVCQELEKGIPRQPSENFQICQTRVGGRFARFSAWLRWTSSVDRDRVRSCERLLRYDTAIRADRGAGSCVHNHADKERAHQLWDSRGEHSSSSC